MAALDPVVGNAINDMLLPGASGDTSGTLVIPAAGGGAGLTLTRPFNIIFDGTRGLAGTGGTAIAGTSSISLAGKVATASASVSNVPTKSNDAAISLTVTTSSGTWNGVEVKDSTGTPKRVSFGPTSDMGKAYAIGDILAIPIGNLTQTVT